MPFPKKKKLVLNIDTDTQAYLDSLVKGAKFADLIFFKEKGILFGSFDKHYGLFTVEDRSKNNREKLKSIVEILKDYKEYCTTSIYSFPYPVRQWIEDKFKTNSKGYVSNHDIVADRTQGTFIAVDQIPQLPEWFEGFDKWKKHTCSAGTLSTLELIEVIQYMTYHNNSEELFKEYYDKIEKDYSSMLFESVSTPSLEKPIYIHLSGNDDCSYGKAVASMEDAFMIYNILKEQGKTSNFHDLIKKIGFIFTN